jgi:hypothetical protein
MLIIFGIRVSLGYNGGEPDRVGCSMNKNYLTGINGKKRKKFAQAPPIRACPDEQERKERAEYPVSGGTATGLKSSGGGSSWSS